MGADLVTYKGRFKDKKGRYEEIRDTLISGFNEIGLEPEEFEDDWEELFEIEDDYLELYIDNCYGNWGDALEYIEKSFIKQYSDVLVEFCIAEYYGSILIERIVYDGKKENGLPLVSKQTYQIEEWSEDWDESELEFTLIK